MKRTLGEIARNLGRLMLFLYWYAAAITLLFYLLPSLGRFLEQQYDSLGLPARLGMLLGFLPLAGAAHILGKRWRKPHAMLTISGRIKHPPG